jgi:hypothetical protein
MNDTNVDKVVFIMLQPIWFLLQASSLPNNCSLLSRALCVRDRKSKALSQKQERTREILTVLITNHAHTYTIAHFTIKWKAKERGNYGCEHALDILSHKEKKGGRKKSNGRLMEKNIVFPLLSFVHMSIFSIQSYFNTKYLLYS